MDVNIIITGDCLKILTTLPERSVDLVITSPPYKNKRKKNYDNVPASDYKVSKEIMRVLKDTGSFILNIKEGCSNGVRETYVIEYLLEMSKLYRWIDTFVWHKTNPFPTGSKKRLKDAWEHCFHFTKTKNYNFFPTAVSKKSTSQWANDNKKRRNKGEFNTKNGSGMNMSHRIITEQVRPSNVIFGAKSCLNTSHPAVFPPYLPGFFISLLSKKNEVVLDPFAGSGTTLVEATKLGRHFIGIEKNPDYALLCENRLRRIAENSGE